MAAKKHDVLSLAYLVFEVSDVEGWKKLLVDVLGMTEGRETSDGMATRSAWTTARRGSSCAAGPADNLVALGFEAASKNAMWDVAMRARENAFVEEGLARDAQNRFAEGLVRFEEPGGVMIEVVHDVAKSSAPLDATRARRVAS